MFLANKLNKGGSLGGYQISRSLRFNSADSAYLNRTPASAGNRRTWTWSGWVKRGTLGTAQWVFDAFTNASNFTAFFFNADDTFGIQYLNGATTKLLKYTTQVFRDPSAWYHIVISVDTTQTTPVFNLYINGVQVTAFGTNTNTVAQNTDLDVNNTVAHNIGRYGGSANYLAAYSTEIYLIDGQALTPSSFGETNAQTGVWQPKAYSGSYGTNGFYLNFSDNSNTTAATLGKDYSGNGNNWTPNGFLVSAGVNNDSLVDSPTSYGTDTGVGGSVRGNYATLNPLDQGSTVVVSNGNLNVSITSGLVSSRATFGMASGKWYWEATATTISSLASDLIGIGTSAAPVSNYFHISPSGYGYAQSTGDKWNNNSSSAYGASWTTGNVIGVALDMDAGTLVFYKNGVSQGTAFSGLSGTFFPMMFVRDSVGVYAFNFGQRPFAYTAPSGFKALCTQNLPTPTIGATTATTADKYFIPTIYTGNGSASRAITNGINMASNGGLVWSKQRSGVESNFLIDNIRGSTKYLMSNSVAAEATISTLVTSFDSTGYSIGNDSGINGNGSTYVSWVWGAGGSGSSNTAGSITSTVSASTTSGFSIVTYSGNGSNSTVGHGLGVAPKFIILKQRNQVDNWLVYSEAIGAANFLRLNTDGASASGTPWQSTTPTSSVVYLGAGSTSQSGTNYVMYCFAEVAGYSKFGSYTGNGSADGAFVYCGFRPNYVLVKNTVDGGVNWWIFDGVRNVSNVVNKYLATDLSGSENTFNIVDFTSNGFKWRNSSGGWNGSGSTYIFAAFAEFPFKYSLAR